MEASQRDDLMMCYKVGRPEVVLPVEVKFQQDLKSRCRLDMQWNKTEWFSWDILIPVQVPPEIKLAGMQHNDNFYRGFMCYGIPLGIDEFVSHQLEQKSKEIIDDSG